MNKNHLNIKQEEITYLSPGVDKVGRVITIKNHPDEIFRLINNEYREFYEKLLTSPALSNLFKNGLIETKISDKKGPKGELVLQHKKIHHINYPYEWSREMIKDAGIFFLDFNTELIRNGFFTNDSHSFNICFDNKKPTFIDFGSISKNHEQIGRGWVWEFFNYFVFPVIYFSIDTGKAYRNCMIDHAAVRGFDAWDFTRSTCALILKLIYHRQNPFPKIKVLISGLILYYSSIKSAKQIDSTEKQLQFISGLKDKLKKIEITGAATNWQNYYTDQQIDLFNKSTWNKKHISVSEIGSIIKAKSVLDVAGNVGLYIDILCVSNKEIKETILIDYDENCLDEVYKKQRYDECLVVDFNYITKSVDNIFNGTPIHLEPFHKRYKGDVVLALAIVHHLVFWQNHTFESIVDTLSKLANKYLIIEFIAHEDSYVKAWKKEGYDWYTQENFVLALEKHFRVDHVYDSNQPFRKVFLCSVK